MSQRSSLQVEVLLRLALTLAAGLLLVRIGGDLLLNALVPPFRAEIQALVPDLRVTDLHVGQKKGQTVYQLGAVTARYFAAGSRAVPSGVEMNASTLAGHVYQVPLVIFVAVLAWPGLGLRRRALAALLAIPACALVLALDVPLVLAGSLRDVIDQALDPGGWSPLSAWMNALNGGGRIALAVVAAVASVALARGLTGEAFALRELDATAPDPPRRRRRKR